MYEEKNIKKKILYITYDGLNDKLGYSQITPYILGLNKNKFYDFTIISFEKNIISNSLNKLISNNNIKWYKLKFTPKYFFLLKFIDLIKIIFFPLFIIIYSKIDLVHCRGQLSSIPGLIARKIFNKKFIFDCRGLWADERLDNKSWNKKSYIHFLTYNFFKKLENSFFRHSDHNVVLTSNVRNFLIKNKNFNEIKFSVIPCCANFNHFKILEPSKIMIKKEILGISNYDLIIGYFGSISNIYHPDEMIKFFQFCKRIQKKTIIIFFSDSFDYLKNNTNKFNELSVKDYLLINSNYEDLPIYYNICDLTLSFVKKTVARKATSPTKIGESLACGVPVISNKGIGDLDNQLNFYNFSNVDVNKDEELKNISLKIENFKSLDREKIRNSSKKYYDLEIAIVKYEEIYKKLLLNNSPI